MLDILIFGWIFAYIVSGVNMVTVDFIADINNELSCTKHDICPKSIRLFRRLVNPLD